MIWRFAGEPRTGNGAGFFVLGPLETHRTHPSAKRRDQEGPARAPARAMLRATGLDDAAIAKPLIAVVHTWSDVSPCNLTLRDLAQHARAGILAAGGTPIEFNTIAVTDGIAMGSERHARLAGLARDHRRFDRAGGQRPLPGRRWCCWSAATRPSPRPRWRCAPRHPDCDPLRRHDHARSCYGGTIMPGSARAKALTVQDVFEAVGRTFGRHIDDAGLASGARRLPRRRRLRRPVHRQHDGDGADLPRPVAAGPERHPGPASPTSRGGVRLRRTGDAAAARRRSHAVERCSRRPRCAMPRARCRPPPDPPTPRCTCWRSRTRPACASTLEDFEAARARRSSPTSSRAAATPRRKCSTWAAPPWSRTNCVRPA
jgi:hypothetical protein